MKLFGKIPLLFVLSFLLSSNLFGSLYEDKCQGSSPFRQIYISPDEEISFNAKLKSEKLRLLADNYNELLKYFLLAITIDVQSFGCSNGSVENELSFGHVATTRRAELRKKGSKEARETFERRRALAQELIRYQRALHEIEREESKIESSESSYEYENNRNNLPQQKETIPVLRLTSKARGELNKLKYARFTILNSYPILDTESWKDKRTDEIFNKPSDNEVTVWHVDYVMAQIFDKSLLEIQKNILSEAEATCEQSTSALVVNDYVASAVIANKEYYKTIYCSKYDRVKNIELFKNVGLVTLSVVAIAAAPLSGGSSSLALAAFIAGTGAAAVDVGLAINDIDNYYDLKRAFLTSVKKDDKNPAHVSYEEVRSAKTQAVLSSILAGAGAVADSIGIIRTVLRYKKLASAGRIGKKNVTVTLSDESKRVAYPYNLQDPSNPYNMHIANFPGGEGLLLKAESTIHTIEIKKARTQAHIISLVTPKGTDPAVLSKIQEAIADLPPHHIDSVDQIYVHPHLYYGDEGQILYRDYQDLRSMLAHRKTSITDKKRINLFPAGMQDIPTHIKREFVNAVTEKLFSTQNLYLGDGTWVNIMENAWQNAMKSDNVAPFIGFLDDFEETLFEYISTNGGRLSPSLGAKYGARFKVLDLVFDADPQILQQIKEMARIRLGLITNATGVLIVGSGGAAHYILNE